MGYSLRIGRRSGIELDNNDHEPIYTRPTTGLIRDEGETHADKFRMDAQASDRSVGYIQWRTVLDDFPAFDDLWEALKDEADRENLLWIPVASYPDDPVEDSIKQANEAILEAEGSDHTYPDPRYPVDILDDDYDEIPAPPEVIRRAQSAQRVLWFCRYSEAVEAEFGGDGAFEIPGEWRSKPHCISGTGEESDSGRMAFDRILVRDDHGFLDEPDIIETVNIGSIWDRYYELTVTDETIDSRQEARDIGRELKRILKDSAEGTFGTPVANVYRKLRRKV